MKHCSLFHWLSFGMILVSLGWVGGSEDLEVLKGLGHNLGCSEIADSEKHQRQLVQGKVDYQCCNLLEFFRGPVENASDSAIPNLCLQTMLGLSLNSNLILNPCRRFLLAVLLGFNLRSPHLAAGCRCDLFGTLVLLVCCSTLNTCGAR